MAAPRPRSLLIPLLFGLFLPQLLLRLPAAAREGSLSLLVPSVEAFLLAAALALLAGLWPRGRRVIPVSAALLAEFLFAFSLSDALLSRFFNRPLALATDFGYLPDLYALMRDTAPRAWFVGGLVLLPLALAALGFGLTRLYAIFYRAAAERRPGARAPCCAVCWISGRLAPRS